MPASFVDINIEWKKTFNFVCQIGLPFTVSDWLIEYVVQFNSFVQKLKQNQKEVTMNCSIEKEVWSYHYYEGKSMTSSEASL